MLRRGFLGTAARRRNRFDRTVESETDGAGCSTGLSVEAPAGLSTVTPGSLPRRPARCAVGQCGNA